MKITNEMIHPELRKMGKFFRSFLKFRSKNTFRWMQRGMKLINGAFRAKDLEVKQRVIQTPENTRLRIIVCRGAETGPNAAGLLWIHGGGFALGSPEQDFGFIRNFIHAANCVVVSPDYTISTTAPYPAAVNDCYQALVWMKEHAAELGIRPDQLFVGGDSAGGGLTAAVCLMARDRSEVNVAFQMPFYPMLDDRMTTHSSQENDAPVWDSRANRLAWDLYLGDLFGTDQVPTYAAPARAVDLRGLPPAYTFVGDIEPFYDETRAYFDRLQNNGINAEIDIYPGCFHAFDNLCRKTGVGQIANQRYLEKFRYAADHYFAPQPDTAS
jgi:acetyl esterase/lipase